MAGYLLLGIAISFATVVFVYLANGYYRDPNTGIVIQNGLVYVDSRPNTSDVYLNGVKQSGTTDARLVIPEGDYTIELKRDGYRDWKRDIKLEGGKLRRLTYARLFPNEFLAEKVLDLPTTPSTISQSNDKRWAVVAYANEPLRMNVVDLNRVSLLLEEISIPVNLVKPQPDSTWEIIEWADDQRTFLAAYRSASAVQYVLIDRTNGALSKNLTELFAGTAHTNITMRDRKNDLLFLHDKATGKLFRANSSTQQVELIAEDIVEYVAFGNDSLLYVTAKDAPEGKVTAKLVKSGQTITLRDIQLSDRYLLEMAKLGGALVMGIGSPADGRVVVYNDPFNALKENDFAKTPVPTTILRVENPQVLTISADASAIVACSGQKCGSHEFEEDRTYLFDLTKPVIDSRKLEWMDGQHLVVPVDTNSQLVSDFDGSNQLLLSDSLSNVGSIFDNDVLQQFSVLPPEADGGPARLMRTFLETPADR